MRFLPLSLDESSALTLLWRRSTEMSLFLNSWIIAVVLSVCNVALVIQMVMALRTSAKYRDAVPPARHPPTRPTQLRSVSSHKSQRSIVSFRDMLARGPSS